MKKRFLSIVLAITTAVAVTACSSTGGSTVESTTESNSESAGAGLDEKVYLTLSGGNSSTDSYAYWIAASKAMNAVEPNLEITVVDATGGIDVQQRVRAGQVDVGNGVSTIDYEGYTGTGNFEGDPDPELRLLWYYTYSPLNIMTSKKLGVKDVSDLTGLKIHPGGTGSANAALAMAAVETLGAKPNWFEAGSQDGIDAFTSGQIDGAVRNGNAPDSQVLQVVSAVDVDFLSFTDEQIETIKKAYPYAISITVPAGSYDNQDYDYQCIGSCQGGICTSALSQEAGYAMFDAMMSDKGREIWTSAYQKGADLDYPEFLLETAKIPIQSGVVQWLVEHGYNVPDELIPEEYTPVNG